MIDFRVTFTIPNPPNSLSNMDASVMFKPADTKTNMADSDPSLRSIGNKLYHSGGLKWALVN